MFSAGSYLAMIAERNAVMHAFFVHVEAMLEEEPIPGITCCGDTVRIDPSTPLFKVCGADNISGFEKYGTMFEIGLKIGSDLISGDLAVAAGLEDQVETVEKDELRDLLVKLVNQTQKK
jgi:hypothetical protein